MTFAEKEIRFAGVASMAGRKLKRYHVSTPQCRIDPAVERAAYEFLPALLPEPDQETPPAGFSVLHRTRQGAFLDAFSWVWGNVIECRTSVAGVPFLGCDNEDPTKFTPLARPWIGCIWELAPFEHERLAWVRHILAPPEVNLPDYLADTYRDGLCGGPE